MNTGRLLYSEETEFGTVQIVEYSGTTVPYRRLFVNGAMESELYCAPELRDVLRFPYMDYFDMALQMRPKAKDLLLIGGGGFAYPWHLLSVNPYVTITVIEKYSVMVRIAKEFFWLDELMMRSKGRLRIIVGDAFTLLNESAFREPSAAGRLPDGQFGNPSGEYILDSSDECVRDPSGWHFGYSSGRQRYDIIFNDAFIGDRRVGRAVSQTRTIKYRLSQDGVYAANVTSAVKGIESMHHKQFTMMLRRQFRHVGSVVCERDRDPYESQNLVVFASDAVLEEVL